MSSRGSSPPGPTIIAFACFSAKPSLAPLQSPWRRRHRSSGSILKNVFITCRRSDSSEAEDSAISVRYWHTGSRPLSDVDCGAGASRVAKTRSTKLTEFRSRARKEYANFAASRNSWSAWLRIFTSGSQEELSCLTANAVRQRNGSANHFAQHGLVAAVRLDEDRYVRPTRNHCVAMLLGFTQ